VRPTTDRAKESLFNILENRFDFEGLHVLDLCSGTGNIALEFASRGCASVTAVDADEGCIRHIKAYAKKLEFNQIITLRSDIVKYIKNTEQQFDIIFADPPYQLQRQDEMIGLIFTHQLLSKDGLLIWEHAQQLNPGNELRCQEKRTYGDSAFSFFK
jgi:16S rRNA (guanine(966)-N(2))-methyltransferase RsmD